MIWKKIKMFLCGLAGHNLELIPDSDAKAEDGYYKCKRCSFVLDYYF